MDWETTMMFYEIVIALDGHAETRGLPTPKNHKAGRAIVERHLPLLADFDGLYSMSPDGRCYNGYDMTVKEWRAAARRGEARRLQGAFPRRKAPPGVEPGASLRCPGALSGGPSGRRRAAACCTAGPTR